MNLVKTILSVRLLFTILKGVHGEGCKETIETNQNIVINMCEPGSWMLNRVFLNITTANVGNSTRCNCSLRTRNQEMNRTTFNLRDVEPNVSRCNQSLIHVTSAPNITCSTPNGSFFNTENIDDVKIVLTRTDTSVKVSYCLFVQPHGWEAAANATDLICQSDTSQQSSLASSTTPLTKSAVSSMSTSTASTKSNTNADPQTTSDSQTTTKEENVPIGAVVGGVIGGVAMIIIIVIIIFIVCKRRKSQEKPFNRERPQVEDHSYVNPDIEEHLDDPHNSTADAIVMGFDRANPKTSFAMETPSSSQTRSSDAMLSISSNPHELDEETPQDGSAVSINPAADSALVTLGRKDANPPNPAGDLYAVVNKPKKKKSRKPPPAKLPKPTDLSTSSNAADVTAAGGGGGDLYAVVDRIRNKGGNAKKSGLPSVEATRPPVPSPPGLTYVDLAEVRGEGRRSPTRPPANMATETEYTDIDHVATAKLSSNV